MVRFSNLSDFILYFQKVSAKHTTYTTFASQPYSLSEKHTTNSATYAPLIPLFLLKNVNNKCYVNQGRVFKTQDKRRYS